MNLIRRILESKRRRVDAEAERRFNALCARAAAGAKHREILVYMSDCGMHAVLSETEYLAHRASKGLA